MKPLDAQFISEARDLLEQIGDGLLRLERDPGNPETVRDLFRPVHTLKGASGIFEDLAPMTRVLHAGEDVLDRVRDGQMALRPDHADLFLEVFDQILEWIEAYESAGGLPDGADAAATHYAAALRALLPADAAAGENDDIGGVPTAQTTPPDWWTALDPPDRPPVAGVAVTYRPAPDVFFQGDDPLRTVQTAPGVLWSAVVPVTPWPALADLDPFVANLEFRVISDAGVVALAEHFHYVADQVTLAPVDGPADGGGEAADAAEAPSSDAPAPGPRITLPESVHAVMQELAAGLFTPGADAAVDGRIASSRRILEGLARHAALEEAQLPEAVDAALEARDPARLAKTLTDLLSRAVPDSASKSGPDADTGGPRSGPPLPAPGRPTDRTGAEAVRKGTAIKVDQERLDGLMDMVGELVVVKNGLPFLARAAEEDHGNKRLSRQIRAQYEALNRVTNALQAAVMRMRMIPVGVVFSRFNRQVRDIARRLDKDIELVLIGEDTEADKTVVEDLADPLVHLIRNACDHGLERAEDRHAAGKPPRGRLTLSARSQDDHVLIELSDDGRGIDVARVRAKALERGLIDEERARTLTDREALNLVLLPGFSTAEAVSDLSGRGVGMDVVKAMVERRGGRLEITSAPGVGTTIRLAVPLSMALTRVMLFDVGGQQFGIPMAAISETRRIRPEEIHCVKDQECIVRRDRIVTLRRLTRMLGMPEVETAPNAVVTDPAVLMLDVDGRETGLVVDRFHEGMDLVVKPMEGILTIAPIYAGTALLGDGRVLPVFNAKELVRCL
ncbi:chemotaxis protein CheA [Roseospira marina]|uniref:Chemotaxis protein CheA n=1 Tax=Roseospira marina TaxID=140057 RepID=A0A5M6I6T3_9PROT|nr:chemotaxis protein CheA [Roseospira marina]KAA5603812.1 chemotaxis protein CheA [Roseospira marina]MBB4316023.1 two-component system chemotaxis sensor kinase CheA [Roseospira marina]MBB5089189.1 two-component system chemotaxis sensor kinase CheA [Roseospira marina]